MASPSYELLIARVLDSSFTVQADRCVYVWSVENGEIEYKLPGHAGEPPRMLCCAITSWLPMSLRAALEGPRSFTRAIKLVFCVQAYRCTLPFTRSSRSSQVVAPTRNFSWANCNHLSDVRELRHTARTMNRSLSVYVTL